MAIEIRLQDIVQRMREKCYLTLGEAFEDFIYDQALHDSDTRDFMCSVGLIDSPSDVEP